MKHPTPQTIYRTDYQPPPFLVDHIELDFGIDMARTEVTARTRLRRNPDASGSEPLCLDGQNLELLKIAIDGNELAEKRYEVGDEQLIISKVPDAFTLSTRVAIRPEANTAMEGLYKSGPFLVTQCEAEGFRKITYALDRPDVMTTYRVRLEADKARFPVLLSNGNLVEEGDLDGARHFAVWDDPFPKPSYLFALVAGQLSLAEDRFTTGEGREVALRFWTEPENLDQLDHAIGSLKRAMRWDEERFGLFYDLDLYNIVVTNDFNMGAMENKSLNIFNARYVLAAPETATDDDFRQVEAVIGHEYFHNWTGNRVTCRDWFQLTLKEGLTVFRDQEFTSDLHSRPIKRIEDVRMLRSAQFAEDAGPMAHPVRPESYQEINNFYTLTVYEKGAEVIRMQHTLLGEAGFRKGMGLYFERHDGQAVTCDDFVAAMADANGVNLDQFARWYSRPGTPELHATGVYDPAAKEYRLSLTQRSRGDEPLLIPIALGLLERSGAETGRCDRLVDGRFDLDTSTDQLVFTDVVDKPIPVLLRRFSAPVKVTFDYQPDELAVLVAHERDGVSRFDAAQRLLIDWVWRAVEDRADDAFKAIVLEALEKLLNDARADGAFRAMVLRMPDMATLTQGRDGLDVTAIATARDAVRKTLAEHLLLSAAQHYGACRIDEAYSPDIGQSARRALRGLCLDLIATADTVQGNALATTQYASADNMTDRLAALTVLVHHDLPGKAQALKEFTARFADHPLVMDKWFAVQASAPQVTVGELDTLLSHPSFSLRNPNKVRSVIGVFSRHMAALHRADGLGHCWLADQVLAVDALNPQVAARIAGGFNDQHRLIEPLRQSAREQLQRLATADLSRDTNEIVTKALAMEVAA